MKNGKKYSKTLGRCPKPRKGFHPLTRYLGRCPKPQGERKCVDVMGNMDTCLVLKILYDIFDCADNKVLIKLFQKFAGNGTESQGLGCV